MSVFDSKACEVVDYEGFWVPKSRSKPMTRVFGLGNVDCTKIFATGFDGSQQLLIYHQHNSERIFKPLSQEYNSMITTWMCIERSLSQDFILVGGMNVETATIGALTFNENLTPVGFIKLNKVKSRSLSRLKRIEGSDVVMAGMIEDIMILRFQDNQFTMLYNFSTYSDYEIGSVLFHTNLIYFLALSEAALNVFELSKSINQSEFYNTELMSPVVTVFYEMKLGISKKTSTEAPKFQKEEEIVNYLANEDITYEIVRTDVI